MSTKLEEQGNYSLRIQQTQEMNRTFANYYPAVDVQSVEDTWWHQVVTKTNSKLLMNNSYGGTAVYGGTNQGIDVNRIKLLATKEIKSPDVIIIFFGINDVVNGRTTTLFESSLYETIIKISE